MSKYDGFPTEFTEGEALCAALTGLGLIYEVHKEAQPLYGYHGDQRPEKANIIVRRHNTGICASNDVGFVLEDGKYKAIISAYDRSSKFNDGWMGTLKQGYSEARQISLMQKKGFSYRREVVKTAAGQHVRLEFQKR